LVLFLFFGHRTFDRDSFFDVYSAPNADESDFSDNDEDDIEWEHIFQTAVDPEIFRQIPNDFQQEILHKLRSKSRSNFGHLHEMTEKAEHAYDFSRFQIKNLVRRNVMWKQLEDMHTANDGVKSQSIATQQERQYVLVKNEDNATWSLRTGDQPSDETKPEQIVSFGEEHEKRPRLTGNLPIDNTNTVDWDEEDTAVVTDPVRIAWLNDWMRLLSEDVDMATRAYFEDIGVTASIERVDLELTLVRDAIASKPSNIQMLVFKQSFLQDLRCQFVGDDGDLKDVGVSDEEEEWEEATPQRSATSVAQTTSTHIKNPIQDTEKEEWEEATPQRSATIVAQITSTHIKNPIQDTVGTDEEEEWEEATPQRSATSVAQITSNHIKNAILDTVSTDDQKVWKETSTPSVPMITPVNTQEAIVSDVGVEASSALPEDTARQNTQSLSSQFRPLETNIQEEARILTLFSTLKSPSQSHLQPEEQVKPRIATTNSKAISPSEAPIAISQDLEYDSLPFTTMDMDSFDDLEILESPQEIKKSTMTDTSGYENGSTTTPSKGKQPMDGNDELAAMQDMPFTTIDIADTIESGSAEPPQVEEPSFSKDNPQPIVQTTTETHPTLPESKKNVLQQEDRNSMSSKQNQIMEAKVKEFVALLNHPSGASSALQSDLDRLAQENLRARRDASMVTTDLITDIQVPYYYYLLIVLVRRAIAFIIFR
jgi:hypothetical protein